MSIKIKKENGYKRGENIKSSYLFLDFKHVRIIFLLILGLSIFAVQSANAKIINLHDIEYEIYGKEAAVTDTWRVDQDSLIIPEEISYEGLQYTVTKIKRFAFGMLDSYRYVKLPKTIISMENCAFACNSDGEDNMPLSTVDLSECTQLCSIPDSCFINLSFWGSYDTRRHLENIYLPNSITRIGNRAFYHCSKIKNITLPSQLVEIGAEAFAYTNLKNVLIPKDVANIDKSAFTGCDLLRTIIYLPINSPNNWIATTDTYVPDIVSYSKPTVSMNDANVIGMVAFQENDFIYSGETPTTTWVNNLEGCSASFKMPTLKTNVGHYKELIPVTFFKDDEVFVVDVAYQYTIKPAELSVVVNNASREYGEINPDFVLTIYGFVNGENESAITILPKVTTATEMSDVGSYPITISGGVAQNYTFAYKSGVLTIEKAQLTAIANNLTKVYGDENPDYMLSYNGLKNNETSPEMISAFNISTDATQSSNVGEYDIILSGGEAKNYEIVNYVNGKLTVTKAPLTVIANNSAKLYGDTNPEFKYSYSGAKNNDNSIFITQPTLSCIADEKSNAGEYNIDINGASSENYEISYKKGILYVNKRELLVSTPNYTRVYGEENPDFEVSYNGFVNNDDASVFLIKPKAKTIADKDSDVGVYDITIEGGDDDNYSFAYNNSVLTIEKSNQSIVWEQEFDNLVVGSQVELTAKATSGLDIEYIIPDNTFLSVYTIGGSTYLDCYDAGEIVVRATQNGNKNYNAAVRVSKVIKVVPTNISGVSADATVKVNGNSITLSGANNNSITINTTNGTLIEKIDRYAGEEIMLDKGVYILRVGNKTMKVKL